MTQSLKIECLVTDLTLEGEVASFLVTKEQLTAGLSKKADLVDGKIQESNLPVFIANNFQTINQKLVTLEESITDGIQSAKDYSEAYADEKLIAKADLVDGKVPQIQLPSISEYSGLSEALTSVLEQARRDMIERTDQIQRTKADLGEDGKVVREQLPNYDKIPGLETVVTDLYDSKANVSDVYKKSETLNVEEIEATVERISPTRDEAEKSLMMSEVVQVHGFKQEYVLAGGYPFGTVLTLDDGITEVVSTLSSNKNNPNENMTGWDVKKINTENVLNDRGKSQEFLNKYFVEPWYAKQNGYAINEKVRSENGKIFRNNISNNISNPDEDMTGWTDDNTFSSISDLMSSKGHDGSRSFVSGLQGGWFEYNKSKKSVNNGVTIFNGWVRITLLTDVYPEWAGAKGDRVTDDTIPIQKALDYVSSSLWDTSVAVMNQKGTSKRLVLSRPYRTTKTIWVGAYTTIVGNGMLGFNNSGSLDTASMIYADLDDVNTAAISSSNWKTGGSRVAFNAISSGSEYDNGLVSATHGLKLYDFSVISSKKSHMGVRIQNSPQSRIELFVQGFDYGVMLNSSWQSYVNCRTLSYKCGLLMLSDNNGVKFDGYYNALSGSPLGYHNFLDFFSPDTDTDTEWNNVGKKFGVVSRYSFGLCSDSVVAEHNDIGVVISSGDWSVQTLYTEINSDVGLGCYTSSVSVFDWVGFGDSYDLLGGANAKVYLKGCTKGRNIQHIKKMSRWNSVLEVPISYNAYTKGIKYSNSDTVLYVSSSGLDTNNGVFEPLLTLDEALRRISTKYDSRDKQITSTKRGEKWTIQIISEGNFPITSKHNIGNDVTIVSTVSNKPTIVINGGDTNGIMLEDSSFRIVGCNLTKGSVSGTVENAAFWSLDGENNVILKNGTITIQSGSLVYPSWGGASVLNLSLYNSTVNGDANAMLISSNYQNASPHIVNFVRAQGTIDSRITGRSDKGIAVPELWKNKILGV